jgi:hypothetical protein
VAPDHRVANIPARAGYPPTLGFGKGSTRFFLTSVIMSLAWAWLAGLFGVAPAREMVSSRTLSSILSKRSTVFVLNSVSSLTCEKAWMSDATVTPRSAAKIAKIVIAGPHGNRTSATIESW